MKIHFTSPYSLEKDLGKAYNESFQCIGDDDWNCITDYDTMLLLPDTAKHIHNYVEQNPEAGILTCVTNRVSQLSRQQLLGGTVNEDSDLRRHCMLAEHQTRLLYQTEVINRDISGFLMVISKKTWNEIKFKEGVGCLGLDTIYNREVRNKGKQILLMSGIYIFHNYRLMNGIGNKNHLRA